MTALFISKNQTNKAYKLLVEKNLEIVESEKNEHSQKSSSPKTKLEIKIETDVEGKYAGSALTEEQKEEIRKAIISLMEKEKLYTDIDITINSLSGLLSTNSAYISQVVNEKFGQNFNNFINEYRIKEARRLLSDKDNQNYTIEFIANSVGFRSISAFNNAFKKYTGITPSYFKKSIS